MNQQAPKVVKQICDILPELAWPVKEVTDCTFHRTSGLVNKSAGCYTTTKSGTWHQSAWVGLVAHQKLESGVYATISMPHPDILLKVLHNGFRESPFGPHPFIKQIITEKELYAIRKKSGKVGVARKLKALLKKTYPFKKLFTTKAQRAQRGN